MKLPKSRTTTVLPKSIDKSLGFYALSATAAGVGVLALASPTEAKIVYTPAHVKLPAEGSYAIDLDHDGTTDFHIGRWGNVSSAGSIGGLGIGNYSAAATNGVVATKPFRVVPAAVAIPAGKSIGPQRRFYSGGSLCTVSYSFGSHKVRSNGQWVDGGQGLKGGYIGVKFISNNELHYGWVRVSVSIHDHLMTAELTGYAYETIPNKPIVAGQTEGNDDEAAMQPTSVAPQPQTATLGLLALGAPGLSIWRREESSSEERSR
jgi:hypothetical protein